MASRLEQLAGRLEAGEQLTAEDLHRTMTLQALDVAIAGERFVADVDALERHANDHFADQLGVPEFAAARGG